MNPARQKQIENLKRQSVTYRAIGDRYEALAVRLARGDLHNYETALRLLRVAVKGAAHHSAVDDPDEDECPHTHSYRTDGGMLACDDCDTSELCL